MKLIEFKGNPCRSDPTQSAHESARKCTKACLGHPCPFGPCWALPAPFKPIKSPGPSPSLCPLARLPRPSQGPRAAPGSAPQTGTQRPGEGARKRTKTRSQRAELIRPKWPKMATFAKSWKRTEKNQFWSKTSPNRHSDPRKEI